MIDSWMNAGRVGWREGVRAEEKARVGVKHLKLNTGANLSRA